MRTNADRSLPIRSGRGLRGPGEYPYQAAALSGFQSSPPTDIDPLPPTSPTSSSPMTARQATNPRHRAACSTTAASVRTPARMDWVGNSALAAEQSGRFEN
jgi:hypothetical protein